MNEEEVAVAEVEELQKALNRDAEASGYHLNTDVEFVKGLVRSLIINERRYGYRACPCRLASGNEQEDLDIVCPCDYRDPDLNDYGVCYCALYVTDAVRTGDIEVNSIPERRPSPKERKARPETKSGMKVGLSLPVWRCKVCGYLCARGQPPEVCPICKAKKDRFEKFLEPSD